MIPEMYIERAVYLGNFVILIETTEGEMRTIDFKPLLNSDMGAFISLRNDEIFKKFFLDTNILTWNVNLPIVSENQINQFDISPEYIFQHSIPVTVNKGEYRIRISQHAG